MRVCVCACVRAYRLLQKIIWRLINLILLRVNFAQVPFAKTMSISNFLKHWPIGIVGRVFADGPGDQGSILGRTIPKTQKIVLDNALLNT